MANCTITVLCNNIQLPSGRAIKNDVVSIDRAMADGIVEGDKAAGRKPRISIKKRSRKSEAE